MDRDGAKAMCSSVIDSDTGLEPEWCVLSPLCRNFSGSFLSALFALVFLAYFWSDISVSHLNRFEGGLGWTYFYRGEAHEKLLELKEALADYKESLEAWNWIAEVTGPTLADHTPTQRQIRTLQFQRGDLLCAGFCGGEQIGAMRSQLADSLDLDASIEAYSFVLRSALTYPGTVNHAVTSARRGMAFLKQDKDEEALADFTAAVESKDGNKESGWLLNKGLCNARLGDWKAAISDYSQALTVNPDNPTALTNRGIIYQRRRMWETAIADFEKAEAAATNHAGKGDALTHNAFCLLKLGKKKKALKAISKACNTYKTGYACDFDDDETIDNLDMNTEVSVSCPPVSVDSFVFF